jgi:class 3 adenylate cyclase/tetratricopeptide (TPR) repeat protein
MTEREKLEAAIAAQEALRPTLGDAVVDMTVAALRDKLAALDPPADAAQRKLVTILFADVSGFTAMSETMDAEEVRDTMNALWEKLDAAILAHGGRVDKHIGDALMAIFGVPAAKEDDPERAVRAALALQAELAAFAARTGRGLKMRVGVNTGAALLGAVGSNAEFTAMGDAVNVASRLEHAAPIGGILISHDTYLHVRGVFDVEPQEPLTVKGKKEAIRTYVVKRAKPRSFRIGTRGLDIETKMVGRDAELKALQDGMEAAFEDREVQLTTVVADAGMGKSRLLYEFTQWFELHPRQFWYFAGRASPATEKAPFGLLRDVFSQRFQVGDGDATADVHAKFERGVAGFLADDPRAAEKAHFIGRLLGFDFSASPHVQALASNAALARERGVEAIAELLRAAEKANPVLLLLEDVHWADDASLDLVSGLLARERALRLFVLALARPTLYERRPSWGEGLAGHRRIALTQLSKRDSRKLVEDILSRVEAIPESLRDMVVNGAEGNPFYVEELIRMLMEGGVIDRSSEKWRVNVERLAEAKVPATLVGVLQARLDSLAAPEKEALQCASVVGRIFWDSSLAKLAPAAAGDGGLLERLRDKDMVFHREGSAFVGAEEYIFKHALLRDVAYESVLKKQRKAYHALAADWLIAQSGARAAEFAMQIAQHYESAEQGESAAKYLLLAAEKSALIGAFDETIAALKRALALLPATAAAARGAALKRLGMIFQETSRFEESLRSFEEALGRARDADDRKLQAQVLNGMSGLARRMGRYDEARARSSAALELARAAGARAETAESLFQLGTVQFVQLDYASGLARLEEALACLRELGDAIGMARCLNNMGNANRRIGRNAEAQARLEEAIAQYAAAGDRVNASTTTANLAQALGAMGRFAEARGLITEALRFQRDHGMRRSESAALDTLAEIEEGEGMRTEALREYRESLRLSVELGIVPNILVAVAGLARLHARAGRREEALKLIAPVLANPAAGGDSRLRATQALELLKLAQDDPAVKAEVAAAAALDPLEFGRRILARPA